MGPQQSESMQALFGATESNLIVIREFFYLLGLAIDKMRENQKRVEKLETEVKEASEYIRKVQALWSVRLFSMWPDDGWPGLVKRGVAKVERKIYAFRHRDEL